MHTLMEKEDKSNKIYQHFVQFFIKKIKQNENNKIKKLNYFIFYVKDRENIFLGPLAQTKKSSLNEEKVGEGGYFDLIFLKINNNVKMNKFIIKKQQNEKSNLII